MMIEKHISALLYRYQCVIVPNFGAFITESVSAKINDLSGTIAPPKKLLSFNSLLKTNDGLLANHIALEEQISYDEAKHLIDLQVQKWTADLKSNQEIYLKNIGEIKLNIEGKMIFEPLGSTNYLTSSFGLSPIVAKIVEQSTSIEKQKTIVYPKSRSKQWIGYAAGFLLCAGLLGSVYQYQKEYRYYTNQSLAVEREVQEKVQQELQQATFYIQAPEIIETSQEIIEKAITPASKPYHIVAGAFRTEAKAKILTEELKKKGYPNATYISKSPKGMKNVVYNSYETAEAAQKELQRIISTVNKDAWIFIEN